MTARSGAEEERNAGRGRLRRITQWYDKTTAAYVLRCLEPLGLVIAAAGILFAIYGLYLAREEIRLSREVGTATLREFTEGRISREASLLSLLIERLQEARLLDGTLANPKAAIFRTENSRDGLQYRCSHNPPRENWRGEKVEQFSARSGQIPLLEAMAKLGLSLRDIQLNDVNLVVPRRSYCKSEGIRLDGVNIAEADLAGANVQNANLKCANIQGATLTAVNLRGSCLLGANLKGADLRIADLRKTDLRTADLRDACLAGAFLEGANLRGANLSGACLAGASLAGAYLRGVDFSGAVLTGLDVQHVNLRYANSLTQKQLAQACGTWTKDKVPEWLGIPMDSACPENPYCSECRPIRDNAQTE